MKSPTKRTLSAGALTAIVIGIVAAMANGSQSSTEPAQALILSVDTAPVVQQSRYSAQARYPGRVRAGRRSQLGFERGGRLAQVIADDGDTVRKDTVIARLDQRQLKAQLAAAQAQIKAADAGLVQAKASQELSEATQARQKTLLEKGHISQQRFDDSTYALRAARAAVSTANAQRIQAQAQAEAIAVSLSLSDLTAPFDGFVIKRLADEGTILAPGSPIFDFEETGQTEFAAGVPIAATTGLQAGAQVTVTINDQTLSAPLTRIVTAIDTNTRTAQLVMALPDGAGFASGEVGQLTLARTVKGEGFWVPIEALQEGARGLWTVFVAKPTRGDLATIERHPVELIYSELQRAFVRGTPDDGDLVVQSGASRLVPGQRVSLNAPPRT
ncbi:MAG: efflux RND transporter periplasmic adaptor subunit [Pseudomonadota bacterium]